MSAREIVGAVEELSEGESVVSDHLVNVDHVEDETFLTEEIDTSLCWCQLHPLTHATNVMVVVGNQRLCSYRHWCTG